MASKAQIIVTIGPASADPEIFLAMAEHQADVARLNFAWGDSAEHAARVEAVRSAEKKLGRRIPIIQDLPGPRVQMNAEHTYDASIESSFTEQDRERLKFGIAHKLDYVALSFVGNSEDVDKCRKAVKELGGNQRIIAKIERAKALESIDAIIAASDAIMVARGDLGNEVPIENIPFIQADLIKRANKAGKPVITATQMLLSMVNNAIPTRAEVTDVTEAILMGSDAVMLSDETAAGKYPVEAVTVMERIVLEAERHLNSEHHFNILT